MADLTGDTFADIFPKILQDPGDGTIQKSDGTEGASEKANLSGGNAFSGVQDFTNRIDANAGISFDGGVNVLGYYEVGTWTPAWSFGTSGSVTINTTYAVYERIGNWCTVAFRGSTDSISSPTGDALMTGLPFTADGLNSAGSIGYAYRWATDMPSMRVTADGGNIEITKNATNATSDARLQGSDFNASSFQNFLSFTVKYKIA